MYSSELRMVVFLLLFLGQYALGFSQFVFTSSSSIAVEEDVLLNHTLTTTGAVGAVTITANALPAWLVLDNNVLKGTPTQAEVGVVDVTISANDTQTNVSQILKITVTNVDDAPAITAQAILTVPEDGSLTLKVSDFTVADVDNTTFTLIVNSGANYTVDGLTITPAANFNGVLSVPVTVSDGVLTSAVYNASVTVSDVNDAPAITAQSVLTIPEDGSLTLKVSDFTVLDVDNTTFTLTVNSGANYTVKDLTITPIANFNGVLTVPVTVSEGVLTSAVYNASVTVSAVNDAPAITAQSVLTIPEDGSLTLKLSDFTVLDVDNTMFTLTVNSGVNYTVKDLTITPIANLNGVLTVPVTVSDGVLTSAVYNASVTVSAVNDAPSITAQSVLTIPEDGSLTLKVSDFTVLDVDHTTFTLTVNSGANYTVKDLMVTPAVNFNGVLIVPVIVSDGTLTSAVYNASVTVSAVNDVPSITAQSVLTIPEDGSLTLKVSDFMVTDVDNTTFTLTVNAGANYTVKDLTITPTANFNGVLSVPVTLSDGVLTSAVYNAAVTVSAVNDAPSINAQLTLTIPEDGSLTLKVSDFTVSDVDNTTFTLTVNSGANYTVKDLTITPAANFNGVLSVPVTVSDGVLTSAVYNASVTVTSVNSAPVITAQSALTMLEDGSLTLKVSDFTVLDVDNTTFTLTVNSGANYTVKDLTISPAANFNGVLSVSVTVSDGTLMSAVYNASVTVSAVNDAPAITAQSVLTMQEDGSLTLKVSDFTVTDVDNTTFTLTVNTGANYTVKDLTITPAANFNGVLTVPVTVSDGTLTSAVYNASVTVSAVNDPPAITAQLALTIPEDGLLTLKVSDFTVLDVDNTTFTLTLDSGVNYTVKDLTITPAANFNGVLSVPVTVSDGVLTSAVYNASVTVTSVNNAPVIKDQAILTIPEDGSLTLKVSDFTVSDVDNTTFTLTVNSGANYSVKDLMVTPAANFNGVLTVPVTVSDGALTSTVYNALVTVSAVNDAPAITAQSALTMLEDGSLTLKVSDFTVLDVDNTTFTLTVNSGANYTVNDLTITPAANFNGVLSVPVTVSDGLLTSAVYNASVTVGAVNDAPAITAQSVLTMQEDGSLALKVSDFTVLDVDNTTFTLTVNSGVNYTVKDLTITPTANFNGVLTVPVTVSDGLLTSAVYNASVTVTSVNNAPVITAQSTLTIPEDGSLTLKVSDFTVLDVDNTTFTLTLDSGANYTVKDLTITPTVNFNGVLTVPVTVSDGASTSTVFNASLTVGAVNDPPAITAQTALTIPEDGSLTLKVSDFTVSDVDNTTFTLIVNSGANYTVNGLTITPTANFNGVLTVPVTVSDGLLTSAVFNASVTVTSVNNAPVIKAQAILTIPEDGSLTLKVSDFTVMDVDNTTFTLTVNSGANYTVKDLTITPTANFSGVINVPVAVSDGVLTSAVFNASVTVSAVNDAPSITAQSALTIPEDGSLTLKVSDFTVTDVDNTTFTLTVNSGANYTVKDLTITTVANFNGVLSVPVTVSDGTLMSAVYNASVTVGAVNDVPSITAQSVLTIPEDGSLTLKVSDFMVTDVDNTTFTLTVNSGANYTVKDLTITPTANFNGLLTVPVTVSDGASTSTVFNASVTVSAVNDAPSITAQSVLTMPEDGTLSLKVSDFTLLDVDNTTFTLTINTGVNYTVKDLTITPAANFNGLLSVPVTVSDGLLTSAVYNASVTVSAVNDAPVIKAHTAMTMPEDGTFTLSLSDFTILDVDNTVFTLFVNGGSNYTVKGIKVSSNANWNGVLTVPVYVSDGSLSSDVYNAVITVTAVNDPPVVNDDVVVTYEDTPLLIDVLVNDNDAHDVGGGLNESSLKITDLPKFGTVDVVTGKLRYTPKTDYNGTDSFGYSVKDNQGLEGKGGVSVSVVEMSDVPLINSQKQTLQTKEDTSIELFVSDFAITDVDTNSGFVLKVLSGDNYTVNGNVVTSVPNWNGTLVVPVVVNDGEYNSSVFNASVVILPVNDAPVVTSQQVVYKVDEDGSVLMDVDDFVVADVDNSTDFVLIVQSGDNYTFNGQRVNPAVNWNGILSVSIMVSDGQTENDKSELFVAQINVVAVNDKPVLVDDIFYTGENTSVNISVLANDSDSNDVYLGGIDQTTLEITEHPKHGSCVILPNKNIIYTPIVGFSGSDGFSYKVSDVGYPLPALSSSAHVTIEVARLSPLAVDDVATTNEDVSVVIPVLTNDTDSGNDINTASVSIVLQPSHGTLIISKDGKVTYTPVLNYNGTDQFRYTVTDNSKLVSNEAVVSLTVKPVNDAPVALIASFTTAERVAKTIYLNELAVDPDDNILMSSFNLVKSPLHGAVSVNVKDKLIVYTPVTDFEGSDGFTFRLTDDKGLVSNVGEIAMIVSDQKPITQNDAFVLNEDGVMLLDVAANDRDPQNNLNLKSVLITTIPLHGIATVDANTGYVLYEASLNYNGQDEFIYQICDNDGYCSHATVKLDIKPVNDLPVVATDFVDVGEDSNARVNVLQNDRDVDGVLQSNTLRIVANGVNGVATVEAGGYLKYMPDVDFDGKDSLVYEVCDNSGGCSQSQLVVTVIPMNDAPVANDDAFSGVASVAMVLDVLRNDSDVDDSIESCTLFVVQSSINSVVSITNGQLVYVANSDFIGVDSITYRVCDKGMLCDQALVELSVVSGNRAPTIVNDEVTLFEDHAVLIDVLNNDVDPDGNLNVDSLLIVEHPLYGVATVEGTKINYTPHDDFYGNDKLSYKVCDQGAIPLCDQGVVNLTVMPVNDSPDAGDDHFNVNDGGSYELNIHVNDVDVDNVDLNYRLITVNNVGCSALVDADGLLHLSVDSGFYCQHLMLDYELCDEGGRCDRAVVYIDVDMSDADLDGIGDVIERKGGDADHDGISSEFDLDSDGDGIIDAVESCIADRCVDLPTDHDGDGVADYLDNDSDGDGVFDLLEGVADCDGDGIVNYLDGLDDCVDRVIVPDTFSPNGDGLNDLFVMPIVSEYPINELIIFNRWGSVIYSKQNYDNSWDGRSSSSTMGTDILPEGSYFYVLRLGNESRLIKGVVFLKR